MSSSVFTKDIEIFYTELQSRMDKKIYGSNWLAKWNSKISNVGGISLGWNGKEKRDSVVRFEFVSE